MADSTIPLQRHHFILDVWREEIRPDETEWRGKVQHLPSGEAYYFRDWPTLIARLQALLVLNEMNGPQIGADLNADEDSRSINS
jgi:hypothetical protein